MTVQHAVVTVTDRDGEPLYTIAQAAHVLGVSYPKVNDRVISGDLAVVLKGNARLVRVRDIRQIIQDEGTPCPVCKVPMLRTSNVGRVCSTECRQRRRGRGPEVAWPAEYGPDGVAKWKLIAGVDA